MQKNNNRIFHNSKLIENTFNFIFKKKYYLLFFLLENQKTVCLKMSTKAVEVSFTFQVHLSRNQGNITEK